MPAERKGGPVCEFSLLVTPRKMRYSTLAMALTTVLKSLSGSRNVELMVSIHEPVAREGDATPSCSVLAASISSRTQITGATAWSTVLVSSGGYFGDECSATIWLLVDMKTASRTSWACTI